jgi:endonuclease YncB( thermonuclease family)
MNSMSTIHCRTWRETWNRIAAACLSLVLIFGLLGCGTKIPSMQEVLLDKTKLEVEDGDTFVYDGQSVRMLGIDAPEIDSPYHEGNQDPWGTEAKEVLQQKVSQAAEIKMIRIPENDKYDRMLAYLILDGRNANALMVEAGMAYESVTHYGAQGLEKYAVEVMKASKYQEKPEFEKPWEWRKKHKK